VTTESADAEDLYLRIYEMLRKDWIAVFGDLHAIVGLVGAVYTPGTPRDANIRTFNHPGSSHEVILIARKCPTLRKLLRLGNDPAEWESLYMVTVWLSGQSLLFESGYLKHTVDRERFMEGYARELADCPLEGVNRNDH